MSNIIECRSLCFSYSEGGSKTSVLDNLNFEIKTGEKLAIIGQSGCGKSTLLNLIAGLDKPSEGDVLINSSNIAKLKEKERTELRSENLGFVYQFHHLLNDFSALYNVSLPLLIKNIDKRTELESSGGKIQVPCLKISNAGEISWLYESNDIIRYLDKHF